MLSSVPWKTPEVPPFLRLPSSCSAPAPHATQPFPRDPQVERGQRAVHGPPGSFTPWRSPTMIVSANSKVWFVTGSQSMYGEDTLRQVAEQSRQIADTLGADLPVSLLWKPVLTGADAIRRIM